MAKKINLALQGGGAHGAFAWGVLDRLYTYHSVTGQAPKPAKLDVTTVTRSGLWYPGPMKFSS